MRASLATDRVFTLGRRARDPFGPIVRRNREAEAADPVLEVLRDGSSLATLVAVLEETEAWDMVVRLASVEGVPRALRQRLRDFLEVIRLSDWLNR